MQQRRLFDLQKPIKIFLTRQLVRASLHVINIFVLLLLQKVKYIDKINYLNKK